jgi:heme exporter protein A
MDSRPLAIEVAKLTKSFDERLVLKGIDLAVEPGESVVIFGPNGAGKSTLMKILATIMYPTSGKVLIAGYDIKHQAEKVRQRIGVVGHNTYLYNNLTAYENLDFYRRLYDLSKDRILEVSQIVGMETRLNDRISNLSRGMQQRFSIARALLAKPSIMLLDEPDTGLDQQAISILWNAFRTDNGVKRTLLLISHNLERGLEIADRIIIISRGKIVFQVSRRSIDLNGLKEAYQVNTRATL